MARSLKKLDALLAKGGDALTLTPALEGRLAAKQKLAIHLNRALLAMAAGKAEQARQVAGLLAKAYAGEPLVALLQAALLAREGKVRWPTLVHSCVLLSAELVVSMPDSRMIHCLASTIL